MSPEVRLVLRHLHHAHAAAQSSVVHAPVELPAVLLGVVHLDGLEVGGAVKATDGHELAVHHRQPHLDGEKTWET